MVPDPYKALNLPHSASADEIKKSYRELARRYHPDRRQQQPATEDQSHRFSEISAAYALLSDPQRKAHYDHIYKYGGYDDDEEEPIRQRPSPAAAASSSSRTGFSSKKRNRSNNTNMGVGYTCTDPFAFVWSQGRIHSTRTVAGIQVPSRLQMTQPGSSCLRFAYSSGHFVKDPTSGRLQCTTKTTQFADGKKFTKTERFQVHPDGRAQVLPGDDDGNDSVSGCGPVTEPVGPEAPWYIHAWYGLKDRLAMCYSPCTAVAAH